MSAFLLQSRIQTRRESTVASTGQQGKVQAKSNVVGVRVCLQGSPTTARPTYTLDLLFTVLLSQIALMYNA